MSSHPAHAFDPRPVESGRLVQVAELGLPPVAAHVVAAIASELAANHRRHRGSAAAYDPVAAALPAFVRVVAAACVNVDRDATAPATLATAISLVQQPVVLAEVHRLLIDEHMLAAGRRRHGRHVQ